MVLLICTIVRREFKLAKRNQSTFTVFKEKTVRRCRRRWYNYLNSECKKGRWSKEEDTLLCVAEEMRQRTFLPYRQGCHQEQNWLELLPHGTMPNMNIRSAVLKLLTDFPIDLERYDRREQLKKSGLGKIIMFLSESDEETTTNRELAKELVDKWS